MTAGHFELKEPPLMPSKHGKREAKMPAIPRRRACLDFGNTRVPASQKNYIARGGHVGECGVFDRFENQAFIK